MTADRRWLELPDPQAPAQFVVERLNQLLDELQPSHLDLVRSSVVWVQKGKRSYLEITLRHATEPLLTCSAVVGNGGATFYRPYTAMECDDDDWVTELMDIFRRWLTIDATKIEAISDDDARYGHTILRSEDYKIDDAKLPFQWPWKRALKFHFVERGVVNFGARR